MQEVARRLEAMPEFSEAALNQLFHDLAAETGLKMVNLAQPVRLALTGRTASPGLYEIIDILGKRKPCKESRRPSALPKATNKKFWKFYRTDAYNSTQFKEVWHMSEANQGYRKKQGF